MPLQSSPSSCSSSLRPTHKINRGFATPIHGHTLPLVQSLFFRAALVTCFPPHQTACSDNYPLHPPTVAPSIQYITLPLAYTCTRHPQPSDGARRIQLRPRISPPVTSVCVTFSSGANYTRGPCPQRATAGWSVGRGAQAVSGECCFRFAICSGDGSVRDARYICDLYALLMMKSMYFESQYLYNMWVRAT
jgi:hypothetical protein